MTNIAVKLIGCIVFSTLLLMSCHSTKKDKDREALVHQWLGKELILPPDMEYKILGRDTLCPDLWEKSYKILAYVDSAGCTSCQLGIPQWQQIINICKSSNLDVSFLFVVHSTNYENFGYELLLDNFNYPIIYDRKNRFDELNHFPPFPYSTFLLDKDNKILLIGSPINNPPMLELYMKLITQNPK
jgi:hypothetical protein